MRDSTHSCLGWSVTLRKIGSVMSSSSCCYVYVYVEGRGGVSHLSTFGRAERLSLNFGVSTGGQRSAVLFFFNFLALSPNCEKATVSFVILCPSVCPSTRLSVRPHVITCLPLGVSSRNLIFEYFSKICRKISSFIKI